MANEKMESLEKRLEDLSKQIQTFQDTFTKGKLALQLEAYVFNEDHEGESSHSLHFHGKHQHSTPRPPKLEMYKFDGSNPEIWLSQMDQYFTLNHIRDDETKLHMGGFYLDQERFQ